MSEAREVAVHGLEVVLVPTTLFIPQVAVRYIGVGQRKPGAFSRALQLHRNRGVGVGSGKLSRAPCLNNALAGYEFDIGPRDVSIPSRHLRAQLT